MLEDIEACDVGGGRSSELKRISGSFRIIEEMTESSGKTGHRAGQR